MSVGVYDWPFRTRRFRIERRRNDHLSHVLKIDVVPTTTERVVPPAGEDHAFDVQHFRRSIEVYVSPTGRSVRVWVDGVEIPPLAGEATP